MDQDFRIKLAAVTNLCRIEYDMTRAHEQAKTEALELTEEYQHRYNYDMARINRIRKWALPLTFYSSVIGIAIFITMLSGLQSYTDIHILRRIYSALTTPFTLVPIIFASIGIYFLCSIKGRKKRHEEKYKLIWNAEYLSRVNELDATMDKISLDAEQLRSDNKALFAFLPEKYQNLQAASYLLMVVTDGRADSLKEAYNLYEEQLHRWKLEKSANQAAEIQKVILRAQEEVNEHLDTIEHYEYIKYFNDNYK